MKKNSKSVVAVFLVLVVVLGVMYYQQGNDTTVSSEGWKHITIDLEHKDVQVTVPYQEGLLEQNISVVEWEVTDKEGFLSITPEEFQGIHACIEAGKCELETDPSMAVWWFNAYTEHLIDMGDYYVGFKFLSEGDRQTFGDARALVFVLGEDYFVEAYNTVHLSMNDKYDKKRDAFFKETGLTLSDNYNKEYKAKKAELEEMVENEYREQSSKEALADIAQLNYVVQNMQVKTGM